MKDFIKIGMENFLQETEKLCQVRCIHLQHLICSHSASFSRHLQHAEKEYYMPELIRDIASEYGTKYFKESTTPPSIIYSRRSRFEISRTG